MKRLTLLTILLVVVGLTAGFAIDVKPTFSLSGSATATWGVDLLTGDHGFSNTADASFTLNLFPADGTASKGADAPWYGSISFANLEFYWTDSGVPVFGPADTDITAKIIGMDGNFVIGLYAKPSFDIAYAGYVPLFSADAGYATTGAYTPTSAVAGGISVAYTFAGVGTITAKIASNGDWGLTAPTDATTTYEVYIATGLELPATGVDYFDLDMGGPYVLDLLTTTHELTEGAAYIKRTVTAATAGSGNTQYTFGGVFSLSAVKDFTFEAAGFYNLETEVAGFGAKVGYTIAGITAYAGFDGVLAATVLDFDLAASVAYAFREAKDNISANAYYDSTDLLNFGLLFTDASGFINGLSLTLGAYAYDLIGTPVMSFAESASYKLMLGDVNYVKPYEKVCYDVDAAVMYLNIGVEAGLIPNTTFKIDFAGGKTANDNNVALVGTDLTAYQVLTVSATVTY